MRKLLLKYYLPLLGTLLLVVALIAPITANAVSSEDGENKASSMQLQQQREGRAAQQRRDEAKAAFDERRDEAKAKVAERKENVQAKLTDNKLKICKKREKNINNIMERSSKHGTKRLATITKISEKTQAFYKEKGKMLTNYEPLVADAEIKKTNAQAAVRAAKDSSIAFKCDGSDPKGAAASFKDNVKAQNEALRAYKTSVKNLIKGVKSVQGTTTSDKAQNEQRGQQ